MDRAGWHFQQVLIRFSCGCSDSLFTADMQTQIVLIDFENVQPDKLASVMGDHFRIVIFVGASQAKIPFEIADWLQRLGNRAEYVKISGNGSNALDFHIAFYIGQLLGSHPAAQFHIVSKDTGFDPLIAHLRSRHVKVERVLTIEEISGRPSSAGSPPVAKTTPEKKTPVTASSLKPAERIQLIRQRLLTPACPRPKTVATLTNWISGIFQKKLSAADVQVVVRGLKDEGTIAIEQNKVQVRGFK